MQYIVNYISPMSAPLFLCDLSHLSASLRVLYLDLQKPHSCHCSATSTTIKTSYLLEIKIS